MKKILTMVIAFTMVFTVFGFCGGAFDSAYAAAKVKISLASGYTKYVDIGGKAQLKASVSGVKWSSSKKSIATVSKSGVVTGKKKGTVKITAKKGKKKATVTMKVLNYKPNRITINGADTFYSNGGRSWSNISATVSNSSYGKAVRNYGVKYSVDNDNVVLSSYKTTGSVGVTVKKAGASVITAACTEGSASAAKPVKTKISAEDIDIDVPNRLVKGSTNAVRIVAKGGEGNKLAASVDDFTFTSSDESVACFDDPLNEGNPVLLANNAGKAKITVTAKEGLKTSASMYVRVTDVLEPGDMKAEGVDYKVYSLDMSRDWTYMMSAVDENGKQQDISITNDDIKNIMGDGSLGFDWKDGQSVNESFLDCSFNYASEDNSFYVRKKAGSNVVDLKVEGKAASDFYYDEDSYGENSGDYELILWNDLENKEGLENLSITRTAYDQKTELRITYGSKWALLTANGGDSYSISTSKGWTAGINKANGIANAYELVVPAADVAKYSVAVKVY